MDRNDHFQLERRAAIARVVIDISRDHGDHFSADMIEEIVTESYDRLAHVRGSFVAVATTETWSVSGQKVARQQPQNLRFPARAANATITQYLGNLAEKLTRKRLRALGKHDGSAPDNRPTVLFLCVHNAGRSQMALGWLTRLGGDRVVGYSGGSAPANEINPVAITAMHEVGIDISNEFPKPWTDDIVRATDVVILMGCGDACPIYPGKRYVEWTLTDPAGQDISAVRKVRDDIRTHVEHLLTELGIQFCA